MMGKPSVLVVGGTGFVGYRIVHHFVHHTDFGQVSVLSRSGGSTSGKSRVNGANYFSADISDLDSLQSSLDEINPKVIIHAASPSPVTGTTTQYKTVTIDGTNNLLLCAKKSPSIRILIYTSSSTIAKGHEHLNVDETYPLAYTDAKAPAYAKAKALAEIAILEANNPLVSKEKAEDSWTGHLCTGALRLPIV